MKKRNIIIHIIIVFFIFLFIAIPTIFFYSEEKCGDFIFENSIGVASLIIALLALLFATITYFSIDSVKSATSMDGNILENELYSVEYSTIIEKMTFYDERSLIGSLSSILGEQKRYKTCIEFSAHLQRTIDSLIWFNFVDSFDQTFIDTLRSYIRYLVKRVKHYESINSGLEFLLSENVKLIIAASKLYTGESRLVKEERGSKITRRNNSFYDKYVDQKGYECNLQDVRGKMAKNPNTQIVYFDSMAKRFLKEICGLENSIKPKLTLEFYKDAFDDATGYKLEEKRILLEKAFECLKIAHHLAESNILWKAIVEEDLLHAKIINFLMDSSSTDKFNCIRQQTKILADVWNELFYLYSMALTDANTYLMHNIEHRREIYRKMAENPDKLKAAILG